ncbi:hypothetical protein CJF42_00090 [Pseudoalteromonas sp. NBT06-2]|uniref:alpha/beta fold hydrolase n=1 Tax=Pseudoalteromonas sp. NBT06-2 TaxID=2025950 RepID=UPI000BA6A9F5|nr:alpha/beta hydrolase [Pseudoalteromonas sp. NBT06-2]PAJ76336.1 hypothetical protein CJF42_00090 [Pseudoalteromonas sp. NBT06-2]
MNKYNLKHITVRDKTPTIAGVVNEHKAGNVNIVALHGWQDNCASFYPLIKLLPQYNWLAFDFPGHGHSQWRHSEAHYYFIDYIDDIYQVIVTNFEQPVHIIGHSMGAMAATLFCACFPELVHSVVLIEGVGLVSTPDEEVVSQLRGAILDRYKNSSNISVQKLKYYKTLDILVRARMSVSDLDYVHCESLMKRNSEKTESGIKLRIDPKLKHHSGFRFNETQAIMVCKQVYVPVKLIIGNQGFKQIKKAISKYSCYYRELTVIKMSGGHHCHMQNPKDAAKIISQFIK